MFQHSAASLFNSASLRSIFDAQSDNWIIWSNNRSVEIMYAGWSNWLVRSYEQDSAGRLYRVVRTEACSYNALLRKIHVLESSYNMPLNRAITFLQAHFGGYHMYTTDLTHRWVKDI